MVVRRLRCDGKPNFPSMVDAHECKLHAGGGTLGGSMSRYKDCECRRGVLCQGCHSCQPKRWCSGDRELCLVRELHQHEPVNPEPAGFTLFIHHKDDGSHCNHPDEITVTCQCGDVVDFPRLLTAWFDESTMVVHRRDLCGKLVGSGDVAGSESPAGTAPDGAVAATFPEPTSMVGNRPMQASLLSSKIIALVDTNSTDHARYLMSGLLRTVLEQIDSEWAELAQQVDKAAVDLVLTNDWVRETMRWPNVKDSEKIPEVRRRWETRATLHKRWLDAMTKLRRLRFQHQRRG